MNKFISRFRFRLSRPFSCYSHSLPSSSNFRFLTLTARELHGSHHRLFDRELLITRSGEGEGRMGEEGRGKKKEKRKRGKKRKRSKKEMVRRKRTKERREEGLEDEERRGGCVSIRAVSCPRISPRPGNIPDNPRAGPLTLSLSTALSHPIRIHNPALEAARGGSREGEP